MTKKDEVMFGFLSKKLKQGETTLILILLLQLAIHLKIGTNVFFIDEQTYLSEASWISEGLIPHRDFFLDRLPAFLFLLGPLYSISGGSFLFLRISIAAICLAITVMVFIIGERLFGKNVGRLSAAIFAISEPAFLSFMVMPDSLYALLSSAAFLILISEKLNRKDILFSGFLLGIILTIRQSGIFAILFVSLFLIYLFYQRKIQSAEIVVFLLASAIPTLSFFLFYAVVGGLDRLKFNLFYLSRYHFDLLPHAADKLVQFLLNSVDFIAWFQILFFLVMALAIHLRHNSLMPGSSKVTLLLIFALSGLLNFFPNTALNHILPLLPWASILMALCILSLKENDFSSIFLASLAMFLFFINFNSSIVMLTVTPNTSYGHISYNTFRSVSDYIKSHTSPDEKILAYDFLPIYHMSERLPDSYYQEAEFAYTNKDSEEEITQIIEQKKTRYIALVSSYYINYKVDKNMSAFVRLSEYLKENYTTESSFSNSDGPAILVLRRK